MERRRQQERAAITSRPARSDSRKRSRKSDSPPDTLQKQVTNRPVKKVKNALSSDQTKITTFHNETKQRENKELGQARSSATDDRPTDIDNDNMAANKDQFKTLMDELHKMNNKMDEMNSKLNNKMDEMNSKLDIRIEKIESRLHDIENKQDNSKTEIEQVKKNVELNEELTSGLETKANLAMIQADNQEQYLRNYNIRIFNVEEEDNESIQECERKVLKLFEEKLKIKVPIEAIDNLHRLGPKVKSTKSPENTDNSDTSQSMGNSASKDATANTSQNQKAENDESENRSTQMETDNHNESNEDQEQNSKEKPNENEANTIDKNQNQNKCRPIIVSFISRRVRREVIAQRHLLKKKIGQKTAPIILAEDLTKRNHALFRKAQENTFKYKKVWTKDGTILAKQHNNLIVRITSFTEILTPPIEQQEGQRPYPYTGVRYPGNASYYTRGGPRGRGAPRMRGMQRNPYSDRGYDPYGNTSAGGNYRRGLHDERGLITNNRFEPLIDDDRNSIHSNASEKWQ